MDARGSQSIQNQKARSVKRWLLPFGIAVFCAVVNLPLLILWADPPSVIFFAWLMPLAFLWHPSSKPDLKCSALALILTATGTLFGMDTMIHAALATALAGWLPSSPFKLGWLASSVAWMPVFGIMEIPADALAFAKSGIVLFGLLFYSWGTELRESALLQEFGHQPVKQ